MPHVDPSSMIGRLGACQGLNAPKSPAEAATHRERELRQAFDAFVGQTFYGQMFKAMRQTLGKPAYFHGGRAEEVFQGQLDQVLTEQMTKAEAHTFTGRMFEQFKSQLNHMSPK